MDNTKRLVGSLGNVEGIFYGHSSSDSFVHNEMQCRIA